MSRGVSGTSTPSQPGSPTPNGIASSVAGNVMSRHSLVRQMGMFDDVGIMSLPTVPTNPHDPSPSIYGHLSAGSSHHTPQSHHTPVRHIAMSDTSMTSPTRMAAFPDMPIDTALEKSTTTAPQINQPTGLDAFEGAMDGFDFTAEPSVTPSLESLSWFSNDWLNAEFPQNAQV